MKMKRITAWGLSALLLISVASPTFAESVVDTASHVTQEMCHASYWKEVASSDPANVLLTSSEIQQYNQDAIAAPDAYVFDLLAAGQADYEITESSRKLRAKDAEPPLRSIYINGEKIDNQLYFSAIQNAVYDTSYPDSTRRTEFAVAIRYTPLLAIPTLDIIGYSVSDPNHQYQNSALVVNEPFIIQQTATVNGTKFYFCYTPNMSGWVGAKDLALFGTYESWLDENGILDEEKFQVDYNAWVNAWNFNPNGKDFIVVNQDKILLESSSTDDGTSEVRLTLSTALRLVPDDEKPKQINGRGTWNNYVVYLPTRDENGQCVEKIALIPQHYRVSVGYLPFTQSNLLDLAFSCLGNRYGWSGMLNAYDCSLYVRTVYRCFGFEMPRNTTYQLRVSNSDILKKVNLSRMSDEQKALYLSTLPIGSILYFKGHTTLYVGTVNGESYVLSALGSVVDAEGESEVQKEYSIVLTSLSCRRKNGKTWLHELTDALIP